MRILTLINCLCFFFNCAWHTIVAQTDTISHKHQLNEVRVSAPITILSAKQWPGSLASIDSLALQSGNAYLLSQQLNSLPGVLMQQGTLNTSRITIRGIGSRTPYNSNRIKAYWGDIPLTDGDGVSSIEDIGFNDINNIQILKGPSSALYGAGLGGVILLNPWHQDSKTSVTAGSESGSYGTYSNQVSAVLKKTGGITWLTVNQLSSEGYRDNNEYKRYNITLKGQYKLGTHLLHYLYNYRHLDAHIPSSLDSIDFYTHPQKAADSWAAIGGYEKSKRQIIAIGLSSGLNISLSNSLHLFGISTALDELRPFNQLDESKLAIGLRNKLSYYKDRIRFVLGFEVMSEMNTLKLYGVRSTNMGQLLSKNNIERRHINIFALLDVDITDKLIIQTGLNYNITQYENEDKVSGIKSDHQYPTTLSPRLGINYQLTKTSNLFAAAGHGFSTPSVEESQMPDGSFNASIKPEEGYHVDVGYRYHSTNNKTSADFTLYWMKMNNLLVTKRESEEIFYGINAGETSHKGIELSIQHQLELNHNSDINLSGNFSHSINKFEQFIDDGMDYSGQHLPGIPEYAAHLAVTYSLSKTQLHINYQLFGQQYLTDSNHKTYGDFNVLNCKLSHSTKIGKVNATFYLGVNNINNTHYASMVLINAPSFGNNHPRYFYPAPPRNCYGGIIIRI
jgi:iron complex outermembrane receptor protein